MSGKIILTSFLIAVFPGSLITNSQQVTQVIKGVVIDAEARVPLSGAEIMVIGPEGLKGTTSGDDGKFRISTIVGRVSMSISYLGYRAVHFNDILVSTGKEIELAVEMHEISVDTGEVVVNSGRKDYSSDNHMASVSARTLRADDAIRFAGGYYDPSRMVTSFAGVSTANREESNEIIIRGNSPRGLLWRMEGIEIPNPNHFSNGQGGTGGAYSAVSSNSLSSFGFYTGAFPAEFGNAISGVMDLDLRTGNADKGEYALQTGMIGAEASAEGPFSSKSNASYIVNIRYVTFKLLRDMNLIDLGESNIAPATFDLVSNFNLPGTRAGNFNIFTLFGSGSVGKEAVHDSTQWDSPSDRWEEIEKEEVFVTGVGHSISLPNRKTFFKTTVGITFHHDRYDEGALDISYERISNFRYNYKYPSLRGSILMNHKLNVSNSLRIGMNYSRLGGDMLWIKLNSANIYDTIVNSVATTGQTHVYAQWKHKVDNNLELNTGIHMMYFGQNSDFSFEPRFGMKFELNNGLSFIAGMGLHSRNEALAVYYTRILNPDKTRTLKNYSLDMTRSLQWVAGFNLDIRQDISFRIEGYIQKLYNVPIVDRLNSTYSILNSSQGLPEAELKNKGYGKNNGIEMTLEKLFMKNYYFLTTLSFFKSEYLAGDNIWHPTYYNNRFLFNFLGGKEIPVGNRKQNSIGINAKVLFRGGYRYTPVDIKKLIAQKRIVTIPSMAYESSLPNFFRVDAGLSFRQNNLKNSWVAMIDIQNITNRENVFRKRFYYANNEVTSNFVYSLGMVPVFNFRIEF